MPATNAAQKKKSVTNRLAHACVKQTILTAIAAAVSLDFSTSLTVKVGIFLGLLFICFHIF